MQKVCDYCGEPYAAPTSRRQFCSRKCADRAQDRKVVIACATCGKRFRVSPSSAPTRKYCSAKCSTIAVTRPPRTINCAHCGKPILTKRKGHKYCSSACAVRHKANDPGRVRRLRESHLGNYKHAIPRDLLQHLYLEAKLTAREVGLRLGVSTACVRNRLLAYGIPTRSVSETKKGALNPRFGKPSTMKGCTHTSAARKKLREHNLAHPRKYWQGKKRPEMAQVAGFGDHAGKKYEEFMPPEKAARRRRQQKEAFLANPERPQAMAAKMLQSLGRHKANTKIERLIRENLESAGFVEGIDFIHQYDFLGKHKFVCDFGFPSAKIVVECDGDYWHANPQMYRREDLSPIQLRNLKFAKAKDAYIATCGWVVLRFWETRIRADAAACVSEIASAITKRASETEER